MEEWRFDLTNPNKGVGVIITASGTTVCMNISTERATQVVAAHNEEWKRSGGGLADAPEGQLWLVIHDKGEGYTEVHSLVMGDRAMVDQWVRHLTNGVKAHLVLQPIQVRRISIADMERVQLLFKEMRQHESDSERYRGLANTARAGLKALGAPLA